MIYFMPTNVPHNDMVCLPFTTRLKTYRTQRPSFYKNTGNVIVYRVGISLHDVVIWDFKSTDKDKAEAALAYVFNKINTLAAQGRSGVFNLSEEGPNDAVN